MSNAVSDSKYSLTTLILFFFTFSFVGWIWEVGLHFVQSGEFVNRGVLLGPWLPIYGSGGVLILIFLRRFFHRPVLTFFLNMILCSVVEYITSWVLEEIAGVRWWDYTGYFLNINGRICLEGSVVFGLGGCAIIYFLAPALGKIYEQITPRLKVILCSALLVFFCMDFVYSKFHPNTGKGITTEIASTEDDRLPFPPIIYGFF